MRLTIIACSILMLSGLAAAQVTVMGGTASYWAPPYGYAVPFVPLVTTPSASWSPANPSPAGASNATWGNVAGARNATSSTLPETRNERAAWEGGHHEMRPEMHEARHEGREERERVFDSGISEWQSSFSAVQLMASSGAGKKAARTYTNQDVQRMNDSNGNVKYGGKSEHI